MSAVGALAVALASASAALAGRPRPRLAREHDPAPPDDRATLTRFRPLLSLAGAAGAVVFFGGPVGWVAAVLTGGVLWRVLGRVESPQAVRRRRGLEQDLPVAVDLLVGAFRTGAAPAPALALVAAALPGAVADELSAPCRRLALGAEPGQVWRELGEHPQLGPLGRALARAHESGASVVGAGERLADELRQRAHAEVEARARSVSTKAAAPLGICFLPAFVLLGIVPVVAGLLGALHLFR